jgi:hypothetical protein
MYVKEMMCVKTLVCGATVDDDVYVWAKHFNWTLHSGYAAIRQSKKTVFLHKVIMDADSGQIIDHKDRNRLNCQRDNLRPVTHSENSLNTDRYHNNGKSPYRGVDQDKRSGRWRAYIQKNRKRKYLGMFDEEIDAARAYDDEARILHGEFAHLNLEKV